MLSSDLWFDPKDPAVYENLEAIQPWALGEDADERVAADEVAAALAQLPPGVKAGAYRVSRVRVQARIDLPDGGSQVITRTSWRELLGKIRAMIREMFPPSSG